MSTHYGPHQEGLVGFTTPEHCIVIATEEIARARDVPDWDRIRHAIGGHLASVALDPFGELNINTDALTRQEAQSHTLTRLPDSLEQRLGRRIAVKGALPDHQSPVLRSGLCSQFVVMHELATVQQKYFPEGIAGMKFNQPYAYIEQPDGREWLIMDRVEGTPMPRMVTALWPAKMGGCFSVKDHPELADLVRTTVPPKVEGALSGRTIPFVYLGVALRDNLAEKSGLPNQWFDSRLHDLRAANVIQSTSSGGSRRYTILDMQIDPRDNNFIWENRGLSTGA